MVSISSVDVILWSFRHKELEALLNQLVPLQFPQFLPFPPDERGASLEQNNGPTSAHTMQKAESAGKLGTVAPHTNQVPPQYPASALGSSSNKPDCPPSISLDRSSPEETNVLRLARETSRSEEQVRRTGLGEEAFITKSEHHSSTSKRGALQDGAGCPTSGMGYPINPSSSLSSGGAETLVRGPHLPPEKTRKVKGPIGFGFDSSPDNGGACSPSPSPPLPQGNCPDIASLSSSHRDCASSLPPSLHACGKTSLCPARPCSSSSTACVVPLENDSKEVEVSHIANVEPGDCSHAAQIRHIIGATVAACRGGCIWKAQQGRSGIRTCKRMLGYWAGTLLHAVLSLAFAER